MENKLLWKLQQDFEDCLQSYVRKAKYGDITIKELLDLGFNNNYLKIGNKHLCLGWKNIDTETFNQYEEDLTEEQLKTKIILVDYNKDGDGYVIAIVKLKDESNSKLFDNLTEENIGLYYDYEEAEDY